MVLVDDNPLACEGVVALIRAQWGLRVLAASAGIAEALQRVRDTKPDLVLLNLAPGGDDSLALAGALHGEAPECRVIIMGLAPLQVDVASFIRAGVAGFIMAGASTDQFLGTIRSVAQGVQVLPMELTHSLFEQLNRQGARRLPNRVLGIKRLTGRQRDVADLVVRGLSNRQIGARLRIALNTVKSHVNKVLSKLAVNSRLEVVAFSRNDETLALVVGPARRASMARTSSHPSPLELDHNSPV
jgi:DNA-binding NarL/FixJ family response regulator